MLIDDMYAVYPSYLSPFPPNRHKQKPIIALLSQYLRLQYTLFAIISLLSLTSILHTVQNYHRWLILPYRPDQIEQQLTLYGTRILLMAMSSSHLCSFVFDTDVMPYQLTSYDTNEFQQMVDFLLTDFNDSTGVGTSTSCLILGLPQQSPPTSSSFPFRRHRRQHNLIVPDYFFKSVQNQQ